MKADETEAGGKNSSAATQMPDRVGETIFYLPSDLEVVMKRIFDAPRELVFKVYTDPQHIPNWWGPRSLTTRVDRMDVRPGGAWRYVQSGEDGTYGFHGEFLEVVPPEKLVYTFEFEGMPGHVVTETVALEDLDGKTLVTVVSRFDTKEERDGMLSTGMESGARESWDRFEEVLQKVREGLS